MGQRQRAGDLSRTVSAQWSKSEKRAAASRAIMEANRRANHVRKTFAQQQHMK